MYRDIPIRTTIATVVPVFLALAQILNGYIHGVSVVRIAGFTAGMVVAAALVIQYHLVQYQRRTLQRDLYDEE
jgi:hypothetical protein